MQLCLGKIFEGVGVFSASVRLQKPGGNHCVGNAGRLFASVLVPVSFSCPVFDFYDSLGIKDFHVKFRVVKDNRAFGTVKNPPQLFKGIFFGNAGFFRKQVAAVSGNGNINSASLFIRKRKSQKIRLACVERISLRVEGKKRIFKRKYFINI